MADETQRDAADQRSVTALPHGLTPVIALNRTFDALYGLEVTDDGAEDSVLRARVTIRDELRQLRTPREAADQRGRAGPVGTKREDLTGVRVRGPGLGVQYDWEFIAKNRIALHEFV